MKPIVFHVETAGELRPVELRFATEVEVRRVRTWRKTTPATDAGEFATLAAKRWFYYRREGATVSHLQELRTAIARNARAEVAFLMVAFAPWTKNSGFLALSYCRRTWCHHFALDFLAVHPGNSFRDQSIRGIGTGMIFGLASLADQLGIHQLWGEATVTSAPFYEKVLRIKPVHDLFIIRQSAMRRLRERYLSKLKPRLAQAELRKHYY